MEEKNDLTIKEKDTTTLSQLTYDLARFPTKETIKMMTFLLEKVIKVNDRIHQQQQTHNNNNENNDDDRHDINSSTTSSSHHHRPHHHHKRTTCFHARSIPNISIYAYLSRILKYCPCANECFLATLVYFDRMSKATDTRPTAAIRIDSYNIHRLIISGVMVSSKLYSDVFFTNTRYAKVGGLPVTELNMLELEFLAMNDFSLFVSVDELQHYGDQLLQHWTREHDEHIPLSPDDAILPSTTTHTDPFSMPNHDATLSTVSNANKDNNNNSKTIKDDLAPPIRRRARHLSIDKYNDEINSN